MSDTADLSVVMPTYKHAHCLPRALAALLSQSLRPREVIVVDDASPDETASVLEGLSHDPVLKVLRNDRNCGANESIRIGMAAATGKYVYCCASDDYVLPGFVEKMVGALEDHPQAGLCSAWFSVVYEATGEVRPNPSGWCNVPRYFSPAELETFMGHASIPGHATLLKRSSFEAAGGLLPDLHWHSDWFLNFVVAFREGICHVPEMLAVLTVTPGSYSAEGARSAREAVAINAIYDRLLSADYADVAPSFRRSGALSVFGPPVVRAAAGRRDVWSQPMLTLIHCLSTDDYESLLEDPDSAVRELAAFFLGTFWREVRQRRAVEKQRLQDLERMAGDGAALLGQLRSTICEQRRELDAAGHQFGEALQAIAQRDAQLAALAARENYLAQVIGRMESSYFWRVRKLLAGCKRAVTS